jgi:molecular chaperone DnaJ
MNGGGFGGGFSGGMTMEDIFSSFGDIFGDAFGGAFGSRRGGGRSRGVNKGSNLRLKVKLTLEEFAHGAEKRVKVNKYVTCTTCHGSGAALDNDVTTCSSCKGTGHTTRVMNTILGQMQTTTPCNVCGGEGKVITKKCPKCYGEGIVQAEEVIPLSIPAGLAAGMQLSVTGKGNAAPRGGINGDLIVVIDEEPHDELIREGNDLIYNLFISIPDAILGANVEVPTIEGKVRIKIDPGTQGGKILRLRGKGLPDVNGYGKGDLLVNVNVWIPKNLSKEELKAVEQF